MMVPGVFVFGSNRAGRHGYGTPLYAFRHYGAMDGQGEGRQGDSYAIPIHDERMKTLPIPEIEDSFRRFSAYAASQHHEVFLLTTVGCGVGSIILRTSGQFSSAWTCRTMSSCCRLGLQITRSYPTLSTARRAHDGHDQGAGRCVL